MAAKKRKRAPLPARIKGAGILPSVVMVLITLLLAAAVLWIVFTRLLRDAWPWQEGGLETANPTPSFQTTQLVLTLVGGIGAAILVVVAYRRQRDLELARFDERFAAAAAQLGAGSAAERLAGVYAMAALADTWEIHRQQCIDVLCGYIRLPYNPSQGQLRTITIERGIPAEDGQEPGKKIRTYEHLPNDREVRLTIISTITSHLRKGARVSWQGHDFNFSGATFDGGDFGQANFAGGTVNFIGAKFMGEPNVSFRKAVFSGTALAFGGAKFSRDVDFVGSVFSDETWVSFIEAEFSSCNVDFVQAEFYNAELDFFRAEFSDNALVTFDHSVFSDTTRVSFQDVVFSGGAVTRDGEDFRGWPPSPVGSPAEARTNHEHPETD